LFGTAVCVFSLLFFGIVGEKKKTQKSKVRIIKGIMRKDHVLVHP
jgi:hypothetical protein